MTKSVVREHHFSPAVLGDFYLDEQDYQGLEYWYLDVLEANAEMERRLTAGKLKK